MTVSFNHSKTCFSKLSDAQAENADSSFSHTLYPICQQTLSAQPLQYTQPLYNILGPSTVNSTSLVKPVTFPQLVQKPLPGFPASTLICFYHAARVTLVKYKLGLIASLLQTLLFSAHFTQKKKKRGRFLINGL